MKVKSTEKVLAPGLSTQLTFVYAKEKVDSYEEDKFLVSCESGSIEVQLIASPPKCILSVSKQVDFGCLIADNRVVSRNIKVTNEGDDEGEFEVKYTGTNSLTIHPKQGIVPSLSSQTIKINFCATSPGKIHEFLSVKLDKSGIEHVILIANVVEQRLALLHPETTEPIQKVMFGSCYYGCDLIQVRMLHNQGPTSVKFVAVMEEDTVGQEIDGDLTEPTCITLINKLENKQSHSNAHTQLVSIIPSQGTLGPNENVLVTFIFKPRWGIPQKGWKYKKEPPLRRDFVIFVQFQVVGIHTYSNDECGLVPDEIKHSPNVEVAVTGTALPVLISLSPNHDKINFGTCHVGEKIDATYLLTNHSSILPVNYQFKRNAHFKAEPEKGSLQASTQEKITFSFVPKQTGEFHSNKIFEVYEKGAIKEEETWPRKEKRSVSSLGFHCVTKKKVILAIEINLHGIAKLNPVMKPPKFNTGITPYITNEVGLLTDITFSEVGKVPRNTRASACASKLLRTGRIIRSAELDRSLVALPNDRAQSIRPSKCNDNYRNLFNKDKRYTYTDKDYMYTDQEAEEVQKNRDNYKIMVSEATKKKNMQLERINFNSTNNKLDLGLTQTIGLKMETLKIKDIPKATIAGGKESSLATRLFSTKDLTQNHMDATLMPVSRGLNAIPTTPKEKQDCAKELSPSELHLLNIGPLKIDFGKVCIKSVNTENLIIVNNLEINIFVVAEMGCDELRRSSPLSQVVPPHCKALIPIVFESDIKGQFSKSITYNINGSYENHICVLAEVVPVALELSCPSPLIVTPVPGLTPESAFSSVITLCNKLNYPAAFTWTSTTNIKDTAFTVRPMHGVIAEYQELDCEVLWTPGYLSPDTGSFRLNVLGGNTIEFECKAQLGSTNVHFIERRLALINCPVNLTTYGTATLVNTGSNHAYFQIADTNPVAGMTITPVRGIIPIGGERELHLSFTPTSIMKFDFNLEVAIRNWRNLFLRVGGSVENPCIEIDVPSFTFGGVCCGSGLAIDFNITNKASASSRVDFDLSSHSDFTFSFDNHQTEEEYRFQNANPGKYSLTLKGGQVIHGKMLFQPTELAAYDFIMPVYINHMSAPAPVSNSTPSVLSTSSFSSTQHLFTPRPSPANIITPRKRVIATGLRSVIEISQYQVSFEFSDVQDGRNSPSSNGMCQFQDVTIDNRTDEDLRWDLDLTADSAAFRDGIITFVHETGVPLECSKPGFVGSIIPAKGSKVFRIICQPKVYCNYECLVPLFIRNNYSKAYKHLSVSVNMKAPKVTFIPSVIFICVPLLIEHVTTVDICAVNYPSPLTLTVQCPEIECDNGTLISPISVVFPKSTEISEEYRPGSKTLTCQVLFQSAKPLSFRGSITFLDQYENRFYLSVVATADNCLLTCYSFFASHQQDYHIICAPGTSLKGQKNSSDESMDTGEAVCVPYHTYMGCLSETSTPTSSSNFHANSSTVYESPNPSEKPSDFGFSDQERDQNASSSPSICPSKTACVIDSNVFPEYDRKIGPYHQNVLNTVQRWFSANAWSGGTFPVVIPQTFRATVGVLEGEKAQRTQSSKREPLTVYHCIKYLTGRSMPGITGIPTIPAHPIERVKQIHCQHSLLLTFLKCQGGCVASIKPEYLMEFSDFHVWKILEMQEMAGKSEQPVNNDEYLMDKDVFELVSKRAWLETLLQVIKCLVLSKITPRVLKNTTMAGENLKMPSVNTDPLCSNVYSTAERILLAWMNRYYEFYREKIWSGNNVVLPPARWVVNFDFDLNDGLVIATLIGAYLPFLVQSHISKMVTFPMTHEHYLHNSLKIVCALRSVGIDYDIQAMDIIDPNPIYMLLFCAYLFQVLPHYIPNNTVEFVGDLTETITKQVKLTNPSTKALNYAVNIIGDDAINFTLPKGNSITIQPKHSTQLTIAFHNVFLRSNHATLILTGRRLSAGLGTNIAFSLVTETLKIIPQNVLTAESPCYELISIPMDILSPFSTSGEFTVTIVEGLSTCPVKKKSQSNRPTRWSTCKQGSDINSDQEYNKVFFVKSFHCRLQKVLFEPYKKNKMNILFLPFTIGAIQCSIIFSNSKLGDFVYEIRATATKPHPFTLLVTKDNDDPDKSLLSSNSIDNSSEPCEKNATYWRSEVGVPLHQSLWIPVINTSKEKALNKVAKLLMSDLEYERRSLTGTLDSSARAAELYIQLMNHSMSFQHNVHPYQEFSIELESKYFSAPKTLRIPLPTKQPDVDISTQCVELPLVFSAETPGHFDCQILLKSAGDIRLYQIECTAIPEFSNTCIEFETPVLQKCTQDIPIINPTNHAWNLKVKIVGETFTGPAKLFVPAKSTIDYPVTYQPTMEEDTEGQLILSEAGGNDQIVYLKGHATEPLALGEIVIDSEVRGKTTRVLKVPNPTKKRLMYEVHSNLPFMSGFDHISVSSGHVGHYHLDVVPIKCGTFQGVINFVAGKSIFREVDSDGDEAYGSDESCNEYYGYRVWYILKVNVKAGPPVATMNIKCPCQKTTLINVNVTNPTNHNLTLEVTINGPDLQGPSSLYVKAGQKEVYNLTFAPTIILKKTGSLRFFHEYIGEFWYNLNLKSEPPATVELPDMECKLGMSVSQNIVLPNNSNEMWEMFPIISDKSFHLSNYPEDKWPIRLAPHSVITMKLTFAPSTLTHKEPRCDIAFACQQQGRISYMVKGCVLLPSKNPPTNFSAVTGQSNSGIVKFYNPLDEIVYVNLKLKDEGREKADGNLVKSFLIHLTQRDSIVLSPHQTLDIPVIFTPTDHNTHYAECVVSVHQTNTALQPADGTLPTIDWCFPLIGIPEYIQLNQMPVTSLTCKMRKKLKTQLEIIINLNLESRENVISARVLNPDEFISLSKTYGHKQSNTIPEISYEFQFPNQQANFDLKNIIVINLLESVKDLNSSDAILIFEIEFHPMKCLEQCGHLVIFKERGCLWRFPILFSSGDPDIDDVIRIEAKAMYKQVTINFYLKAPYQEPKRFITKLTPSSDPEISVTPQEGEFNTTRARGTCFSVNYNPTSYGQKKFAVVYIQTDKLQWTYSIEASLPQYKPPVGKSLYSKDSLEPLTKKKFPYINFISENRQITTTAVSSPFKGAPILKKLKHKKRKK